MKIMHSLLLALLGVSLLSTAASAAEITVSAAISLKEALSAVAKDYESAHAGAKVVLNFASSGVLQKQMESGAPVDVFVSAGEKEMNALDQEDLLAAGTRGDLLGNTLVLAVPSDSAAVHSLPDLASADVKRIAIGDPKSVPAGQYAQQALAWAKLWDVLQPKLVFAENVRQVLAYVESGNVDAGIVYATDAKASAKVRVAAGLPEESHAAITYPAAVLKASKQQDEARDFLAFLHSETARAEFVKRGFSVLDAAAK